MKTQIAQFKKKLDDIVLEEKLFISKTNWRNEQSCRTQEINVYREQIKPTEHKIETYIPDIDSKQSTKLQSPNFQHT